MLKRRIVPCLDIHNGRTVKGVNFVNIKDAGDPVELAKRYVEEGADELVFLDITATIESRKSWLLLIENIARNINIPFTVGGGIGSKEDVKRLLEAGADKVSVNSAAVKRPELIEEIARSFGSQCLVVAIDADLFEEEWKVVIHGGRTSTQWKVTDWAKNVSDLGAGEILLTSMQHDGSKSGFALDLTREVASTVSIPLIASGGAGIMSHFYDLFSHTEATAGLAASIFHYGEISIPDLKTYLKQQNIAIR